MHTHTKQKKNQGKNRSQQQKKDKRAEKITKPKTVSLKRSRNDKFQGFLEKKKKLPGKNEREKKT